MRWLALPLLLVLGCKDDVVVDRNLTGVELTVWYAPQSAIDQIEISGAFVDGTEAFPTGRLPETPRLLTGRKSSLVLLLPDELAGRTIEVRARGLRNEVAVSQGEVGVTPVRGRLITSSCLLAPLLVEKEECIDADGDGYGEGAGCLGPDCNDAAETCNVDCDADVDGDGTSDCNDTCVDRDGDGYGVGPACTGPDCNDESATCTTNCDEDLDLDLIPDCSEICVDMDGDGYGTPGGAGTCLGMDCTETSTSCNVDCSDTDLDGTFDCEDDCLDADFDGYGDGPGCLGLDCDDGAATCNVDCTEDADDDGLIDCADPCLDLDGDGYGVDGIIGTCLGADCDETRVACNVDCAACLPASLTLTSSSPVAACTDNTLTAFLDGYDGAADDISCTAQQFVVLPMETFANGFGRWGMRSNQNDVTIRNFPDGFPQSCNTSQYVRIRDRGTGWFELSPPLDATNLENLRLRFRAGYTASTGPGQNLAVQGCCGQGCNPQTFGIVANGSTFGGTDECTNYDAPLPNYADDCPSLRLRFSFANSSGHAGIDNITIVGEVISLGTFNEPSPGIYNATARVCEAVTIPVTCTWDDGTNPPLSDSTDLVFD